MLLTIIIPSFRQSALLEGALQSIEQQTFKDYEVLVMDGGSKDNTAEVVSEFAHLPVTFYSEPDKGIYDAMNKGIERSAGDFLYFMGCDDRLADKDVLEKVFNLPGITRNDVIYGDVIFIENGVRHDGEFTYFKLYLYNISHQAMFTHRRVFERLGNFDIRYKAFADWAFNMRWFDTPSIKREYIPVVIANYSTSGFSSLLQDDVFYAEQAIIKQKYFPKIVRYLAVNTHRPIHRKLIQLLTFRRIVALNFLRSWLE